MERTASGEDRPGNQAMNAPEWVMLDGKLSHHPGDCVS